MSEQETQSWKANTSGNYYLGKHHMIIAEIFLGIIAAVMLASAVFIFLAEAPFAAKVIGIAIFGFVAIATFLLVGGYRYEVYSGKLVIRVGFLRIPLRKIALDSIISVCTDKYAYRSSKIGYIRLRKSFGPDFPDSSGASETDLIVSGLWRQFKPVLLF